MMSRATSSFGFLMEILKPTTTAAAVDPVCQFNCNCGGVCKEAIADTNEPSTAEITDEKRAGKDKYPWEDETEERTSTPKDREDYRDDQEQSSAHPNYSEYSRNCDECKRQHSEPEVVKVCSADVEEGAEGCLFGEFGFGEYILGLFSSFNPARLMNLRNELEKTKESNEKLEWELKTQLIKLRQEREAIERKLLSDIDNEVLQTEFLAYLEASLRVDKPTTEYTKPFAKPEAHKNENQKSKPLVKPVSSTIGVSSSTAGSTEDYVETKVLFRAGKRNLVQAAE